MDVLSRLKLLNALRALTPPDVFSVRSFTAKGICVHEPVQGLNLNRRSISGLEPEMPVTQLLQVVSLGGVTKQQQEVQDNLLFPFFPIGSTS